MGKTFELTKRGQWALIIITLLMGAQLLYCTNNELIICLQYIGMLVGASTGALLVVDRKETK